MRIETAREREGARGVESGERKKKNLTSQASTPPRLTSPVGPPKKADLGRFSGRAAS